MIAPRKGGRPPVDAPSAVAAAAYLIGINQLIVNLQPLVLGALAETYHLSDTQLGHVSAIFIGFNTVAVLSAPFWVRRVNWRTLTTLAVALAAGTLAAGSMLSSLPAILVLFAVLGVVKGTLGAPSFASLGDTANPDRSYAASLISQSLLAAAVAVPFAQWIIPKYGVVGLFLGLAGLVATGLVAARWLPADGAVPSSEVERAPKAPLRSRGVLAPAIGLLALGLFVSGILSFWYFVERIGVARGVPHGLIGAAVGLCSLATVATAGIVAWLGGRLASLWFVGVGNLVILAGYACLTVDGNLAFIAVAVLFAMGWGFAQPGYWTVIRKVDATGRLFVAAPAAGGLAGVVTGIVAGPIIEHGGYTALIFFSSVALAASAICLVLAQRTGAMAMSERAFGEIEADPRCEA